MIIVTIFALQLVFGTIFTLCMRKWGVYGSGEWF